MKLTKIDSEKELPKEEGEYGTNFGALKFRENSFWAILSRKRGGNKPVKIVTEWWLKENTLVKGGK